MFCHYEEEYEILTNIRKELTEASDDPDQKYFKLHNPIIIHALAEVPETVYSYLYIRKPDPYRSHVGDLDFVLEKWEYQELKDSLLSGSVMKGVRVFERADLDMIELYDPDIDGIAYVSTDNRSEKVRKKLSEATTL